MYCLLCKKEHIYQIILYLSGLNNCLKSFAFFSYLMNYFLSIRKNQMFLLKCIIRIYCILVKLLVLVTFMSFVLYIYMLCLMLPINICFSFVW
jgi:hypothetical protein